MSGPTPRAPLNAMHTKPGEFRDRQLGPTLMHAARHPFYRAHWAGHLAAGPHAAAADAWSLLAALPPTERRHLSDDLTPLLEEGDEIVGVGFSSGSTGSILARYVTARERAVTSALTAAAGLPRAGAAGRALGVRLRGT